MLKCAGGRRDDRNDHPATGVVVTQQLRPERCQVAHAPGQLIVGCHHQHEAGLVRRKVAEDLVVPVVSARQALSEHLHADRRRCGDALGGGELDVDDVVDVLQHLDGGIHSGAPIVDG